MNGSNRRGPKRRRPLDPSKMINTTLRVPVALLLQIDAEAARMARETGLAAINRSDVARMLLTEALTARASHANAEVR